MRLTQDLDDLNRTALIDLFGVSVVYDVEAALSEKDSKLYVRCLVREKNVQAKREELVRQLWLHRLVTENRYPVRRLGVEYPALLRCHFEFGSTPASNLAVETWG